MKQSVRPAEITWSIMHPTPLDGAYVRRLLEQARKYRVDNFEICGECTNDRGGMEGLVSFDGYGGAKDPRTTAVIEQNRQTLREIVALAHEHDLPVIYWHREVMVPEALVRALPGLLDENDEFNLLGEAYTDLLRYKIEQTFKAVPELDGLALTLTESDYSVIHNSRPDRYPPAEVVARLVRVFAEELAARNKRFVLRSFGSIAQDYADILAGAAEAAKDFPFEIETKATAYDFDIFLPPNPYLCRTEGATLSIECDGVGEFLGSGHLPAANVERIVADVRNARAREVDRYAIRLDRCGVSLFDTSYEINLYAYHRAIDDPAVTPEQVIDEWAQAHWGDCADEMKRLAAAGLEVVKKTCFIFGNVIFHTFPLDASLKWIKAAGVFALFKQDAPLDRLTGIWSILTTEGTPADRQAIVCEKEEAWVLADRMLGEVESLADRLPRATLDQLRHEWTRAKTVASLYAAFCRVVCAYFDGMEQGDAAGEQLAAAVKASEPVFAEHLTPTEMAQPSAARMEAARDAFSFNTRGVSVKNLYAMPLWVILRALQAEYAGEWAARARWQAEPGVSDFILPAAATDDWRVERNMHASHCRCVDGQVARQVGNTIFPNGFIAFELTRPAAGEARFLLECNPNAGQAMRITFDDEASVVANLAEGRVEVTPPVSDRGTVRVRLEKVGAGYPEVYAAAMVGRPQA